MELKESGEMYLETIYILSQELDNVRSLDVARYMKFSKPSVSRAMGLLRNSRECGSVLGNICRVNKARCGYSHTVRLAYDDLDVNGPLVEEVLYASRSPEDDEHAAFITLAADDFAVIDGKTFGTDIDVMERADGKVSDSSIIGSEIYGNILALVLCQPYNGFSCLYAQIRSDGSGCGIDITFDVVDVHRQESIVCEYFLKTVKSERSNAGKVRIDLAGTCLKLTLVYLHVAGEDQGWRTRV